MKNAIYIFFCLVTLSAFSQNFIVDQYVYGGDWSDQPIKIIEAENNLYLFFILGSGTGTGNLNYETLTCGGFSTLVVCLDANGNSVWQKMYCGNRGDIPRDMIDVGDGIIMGISSSSDAGTGNKTAPLFTNQQSPYADYWIIKIDYDGNIIWQKTYGSYQSDYPKSLALTDDNKILVTGYSAYLDPGFDANVTGNKTAPNKGKTDLWVLLLDENGDEIWQKTFGVIAPTQSHQDAFGGVVLPNGNFLILGRSGFLGISGDKSVESYGNNGWLLCLDPDGNILWDKIYGGTGGENNGHVLINDNYAYLIFKSFSSATGNRTTTVKGLEDILIYKVDFNGNIIAQTCFGDAGDNDVYSAYLHNDKIILSLIPDSEGPSIDKSEPNQGPKDLWILSFNTETLALVNEKTYGGTDFDLARSVVFFNEHLYITGWSSSGIGGDKTVANFGIGNAWILKVNPTHLLSAEEHFLFESILYPNPATNQINIAFSEPTQLNKAVLYDVTGKIIREQNFMQDFEQVFVFNTKDIAAGVYTLRLEGNGFVRTQQLVVE